MEDPAWQKEMLNPVSATIGFNVLGVGMGFPGFAVTSEPSNANLAVGDDQVVQWVNGSFAIFDKLTGVAVTGPIAGNLLWTYLGGPCATENSFYITAQWDKIAHRWVMAENTIAGPKYYTCIAVSRSDDALGQYWLYSYQQPNFPDDPRWGLWTDAYYQSQNMFTSSSFVGARPCAYDRASLLIGTGYSASQICVQLTPTDDSLLPADLDSPNNLPPANQPEIYLGSIGYVNNQVNEYTFKPDFVHQTATITGPTPITVDPYTLACGGSGGACIPQAGTTEPLDSIGDRLMYRLAYRRYAPPFGANRQQWLTNHAVDVNGTVGERWYEFRASLTAPGPPTLFVYQQGTYSPDATYRWMGSIASDQNSDILMGYSTSSSSQYPSIY